MADDPRVLTLLRRWQLCRDRGIVRTAEELCRQCPELLDQLRPRLQALLANSHPLDATQPPPEWGADNPARDHSPPRLLGRYLLEELLGEGAFGQVFRGYDPDLERTVAIKVPRPERLAPEQRAAFLDEARRLAALEHPGIVQIYDFGQEGEIVFLVSRLVTGGDLARRLAIDRPGPRETARLLVDLAEALHYAHQQGFVHRDIKPANILLDGRGRPLLGDFGQAVSEEEQRHEEGGGIVGTLLYMAPEQARGDSHWVDGRADIYSLGVILYELLTGRRPFQGKSWAALREQILSREPRPPRALDEQVPRELDRICLKCLAKSPAARYATAGDLAEELSHWLAWQEHGAGAAAGGSWLETLAPLNFDAELCRLRKDFVGRAWLDAELEQWLGSPEGRVFLLVGDPGAGKSAYLAHVAGKYPQVAAYHFCVASLAESLDPARCVQSLAAQIAERHPDYRRALGEVRREPGLESDAGVLLRRLVADPLRAHPPEQSILLVIDALDEALTRREGNIARVLGERLDDLPPSVRLVLSARKEPDILDHFSRAHVQEIEAGRSENLRDVASYLEERLREPALAGRLLMGHTEHAALARLIAQKAAGNFLYATHTLQAIGAGQLDPGQPDTFPEGLLGVYQGFFERLFPRREDYDAFRPLLDVITAAREPLTVEQLAGFLAKDRFEVEADLQKLAALFPERGGRYRAFHKSISDWLCGTAGRSKTFRINVQAGHRRIGAKLLEAFQAGRREPMILAHLPTHLLAAERWDDLKTLLTDLHFVEAKCAAGQTFALVNDYRAALAAWPVHDPYDPFGRPPEPPANWLRECTAAVIAGALDPHPHQGTGPTLARLLGQAVEALTPTPAPESLQVLAQMRAAETASQEGPDPYRADTLAGRVQAFANLVAGHAHFLQQNPSETIPLARNEACTGFVAELSEPLAEALSRPWVAREPRPRAPRTRPVCLRTLRGHTDVVLQVALSADGRTAVSSSQDQTLRVWDVASGECLRTLTGHDSSVAALALTPDGRTAVSGADGGGLRLWNVGTGECVQQVRIHGARIQAAALTPDGRLAAFGSRDGTLFLWDVGSGTRLATVPGTAGPFLGVYLTPDGKLAATAAWNGSVQVWDVARRTCLRTLQGHVLPATNVTLSADGRIAFSASYDQTLRVWDTASGQCLRSWSGHGNWIQGLALTPDGQIGLSAGWDGSVRVWDVAAGECVRALSTSPVCSLALTPDGTLAATACYDQTVRIWDFFVGTGLPAEPAHDDIVFNFAWTAGGARAVTASRDQTLRVWDIASGQCLRVLRGHTGMVHGLALSPDERTAISTSWDSTLRLWDLDTGQCLRTLDGHRGEVRDVALTADGQWAVSAAYDHSIRLWHLGSGQCVRLMDHCDGALSVAVSPDGRLALSGGWDGSVCVWDVETGLAMGVLEGHSGWVTALALTPDARLAVSASRDNTLRVWDVDAGRCLHVLHGHTDEVLDVSVSPDGRLALSASDDNTVRVWELGSGRCLAVYYTGAEVRSVSGLWPGGRFACGTVNGQVHHLALRNYP